MKKRYLAFFLICFLIFLPNLASATPESDALRATLKAQVIISTTCTLTASLATGEVLLQARTSGRGNGYFIEHDLSPHIVMTAGHVVNCSPTEDVLKKIKNIAGNAPGFSIDINAAISVIYKNQKYAAKVLKSSFDEGKPDYAVLLNVNMSDAIDHYRLPTLTRESAYGVGDEAVISGKMPFGDWEPYLKKVLIAKLDDQNIQFSEPIYKGMSGSPVLFYYDGKYRSIGIIVIGGFIEAGEALIPIDYGIATRLKKEFLEIDLKSAPAK